MPSMRVNLNRPGDGSSRRTSALAQRSVPTSSKRRQRPRWWLQATTPSRTPSVTQTLFTKWPMRVDTRTRSSVRTPSRAAARVDQRRQPEGRHQDELVLLRVDPGAGDVALDVARQHVLGPLPVGHRLTMELEAARRRSKAGPLLALGDHADRLSLLAHEAARLV